MDHLLIATAADCRKGYYETLRKQVNDADIDFLWKEIDPFSWRKLVLWELEVAKAYPDALIAFCDTWDTLFLGTRSEFLRVVTPEAMLIHSEKVCWPDSSKVYPDKDGRDTSPWRFVNGTGPAGIGSAIAEAIEYGLEHFPIVGDGTGVHDTSVDNDQRFWTDVYLSGYGKLDTECRLSQSLVEAKLGDFSIKNGRLVNKITGSRPLFIHANGAQSMLGWKGMMDLLITLPR